MDNLKITLYPQDSLMLSRNTTIDGILLAQYYAYLEANGKILPFDETHATVNFIHREHGVFSGSIWYLEKDAMFDVDIFQVVKKTEATKVQEITGEAVGDRSSFKGYMTKEELIVAEAIHFYIKGEKEIVYALLSNLKSIGKKQNIGFGRISKFEVEVIGEDKGFLLDDTTPSKPLPCSKWDINSHKVAFSRTMTPYYLNHGLEACYMPTTSLVETKDNSFKNKGFKSKKDMPYSHACDFLFNNQHTIQAVQNIALKDDVGNYVKNKVINKFKYTQNNDELVCAVTGKVSKNGFIGNPSEFAKALSSSFADHDIFSSNTNFISHEAVWALRNISALGFLYSDLKTSCVVRGKQAHDGNRVFDFISNPNKLVAPFVFHIKDTSNQQHMAVRSKVSLSNAYFYFSFGKRMICVDNELLQAAISDIERIVNLNNGISKTHLVGLKGMEVDLKKEFNTVANNEIIMNFRKRYGQDIMFLLSNISLDN